MSWYRKILSFVIQTSLLSSLQLPLLFLLGVLACLTISNLYSVMGPLEWRWWFIVAIQKSYIWWLLWLNSWRGWFLTYTRWLLLLGLLLLLRGSNDAYLRFVRWGYSSLIRLNVTPLDKQRGGLLLARDIDRALHHWGFENSFTTCLNRLVACGCRMGWLH